MKLDVTAEPAVTAGPADLSAAVTAAQAGDERAFRELFRAVQPALLRYLRGLIGDDADDVASETWLQICRDLPRFAGDYDNFRAWAATIARHRAMDHVRKLRRRPSVPVPVEALADLAGAADTEHEAADAVATGAAVALLASLPAQQAEAVLLRVVMGLDAETVGRILGKRPGAVRTAAYRGLRRLAELMPPEEAP
ncbi:RNA polymerase sigma factor [Asanoa sp. WMMD1127]|uniref:RNA polymerase sigma factor n=1 Tax=Asanoa sp. WMMD1127 TaxID=3016107 RepID=UPI0024179A46|nr:RNA polymerase sigma factor [Asanoa sp. WMMD1127]MDG4824832.1 RNA polymerase sigma factor [Asanoa sp. WMMD1127]